MQADGSIGGTVSTVGDLPGAYLEKLFALLREQGLAPESYLESLVPDLNLADWRNQTISYRNYLGVIGQILEEGRIPDLGVRLGRMFSMADYGILGYAMLSSRDLRELLAKLYRYVVLIGGGGSVEQHSTVEGDRVSNSVICSLPPGPLRNFELELTVAQQSRGTDILNLPATERFIHAKFSFPKPAHATSIQEALDCPVYYDQEVTELVYPASWLDAGILMSNELAARVCEEQCALLLDKLENRGGVAMKLRRLVLGSPGSIPSIETVAQQLNMSSRTLRRKLSSESSSFQDIVNEVRMGLAAQYLKETRLSIKEISHLLNYSDVPNFQRAFKNWSGSTPGAYRSVANDTPRSVDESPAVAR